MTYNDACIVGVGFRQREFPNVVERVLSAVDYSVVSGVVDGNIVAGVGCGIPEVDKRGKAEEVVG